MRFAPIVPLGYLPLIAPYAYHMSLAHVAQQSAEYLDFYRTMRIRDRKFVILDNGAAEDGQMNLDAWFRVIKAMNPTEIVLYDVIGNKGDTKASTKASYQFLVDHGYPVEMHSYMGVPHGETYEDVISCAKWMIQQEYINTIGVSKFLNVQFSDPEIRLRLITDVTNDARSWKPFHILGCDVGLSELVDLKLCHDYWIRGADSAMPFLFAMKHQEIRTAAPRPKDVEINFLYPDADEIAIQAAFNIQSVMDAVG